MTRYLRADGSFDTYVGVVGMTSQPSSHSSRQRAPLAGGLAARRPPVLTPGHVGRTDL
jgi:hypothetical protein